MKPSSFSEAEIVLKRWSPRRHQFNLQRQSEDVQHDDDDDDGQNDRLKRPISSFFWTN